MQISYHFALKKFKNYKTKKKKKTFFSVPAGMYRTGTYTGIKTPTFRTSLNTGR